MQHLLLLHGAIGAKDQLANLADEIKEDFIVHLINFNGHGDTPYRSFSIKDFADDVLEYLIASNIDSVNIFGYSMGGYVAMYLAKYYPDKIKSVITLATKFYWDEAVAAKESAMLNAEKIEEKVPAFAQLLAKRHAPNDWKTVLQRTKVMLVEMGNNNPLLLEDHASISQPVLIMLGDKDKMVSMEETIAVYEQLPNGKLMILPETEHPIEKVDVGKWKAILVDWLG